ncbi:MAG: hypothetical protein N2053_05960 [Chitinispirillaceae bacterium]|nr:hypothetical protein [Chitinispirillaceae bacterium]
MKKIITPDIIKKRQKIADAMVKKLADGKAIEQNIITFRKRHLNPITYLYVVIATSIVSLLITVSVVTGKISLPGLTKDIDPPPLPPEKSTLELLNEDLASEKISPDIYAIYIIKYLTQYDSLPDNYKTKRITLTSDNYYEALSKIWTKLSMRTRQNLLKEVPYLEQRLKELYEKRLSLNGQL